MLIDRTLVACLERVHRAANHHRAELTFARVEREARTLRRHLETQCHSDLRFSRLEERGARKKGSELCLRAGFVASTPAIDVSGDRESSRGEYPDVGATRRPEVRCQPIRGSLEDDVVVDRDPRRPGHAAVCSPSTLRRKSAASSGRSSRASCSRAIALIAFHTGRPPL